jgi:hypothetical protein
MLYISNFVKTGDWVRHSNPDWRGGVEGRCTDTRTDISEIA